MVKVIGKISIPETTSNKVYCDDCRIECDCSFGDSRIKSTITYHDGSEEVIMRCIHCDWFNWGQFEPHSIFG